MTAATGVAPAPSCPLCHTVATGITAANVAAGMDWLCVICDMRWDAARLETVAAYARYVEARAAAAASRT